MTPEEIVEKHSVISEWERPIHIDCIMLQIIVCVYFIAKNGKKCLSNALSVASIDRKYLQSYSPEIISKLKDIKLEAAKKTLICLLEKKLEKRSGLKYHKGYFSFQNIEPYRR